MTVEQYLEAIPMVDPLQFYDCVYPGSGTARLDCSGFSFVTRWQANRTPSVAETCDTSGRGSRQVLAANQVCCRGPSINMISFSVWTLSVSGYGP